MRTTPEDKSSLGKRRCKKWASVKQKRNPHALFLLVRTYSHGSGLVPFHVMVCLLIFGEPIKYARLACDLWVAGILRVGSAPLDMAPPAVSLGERQIDAGGAVPARRSREVIWWATTKEWTEFHEQARIVTHERCPKARYITKMNGGVQKFSRRPPRCCCQCSQMAAGWPAGHQRSSSLPNNKTRVTETP